MNSSPIAWGVDIQLLLHMGSAYASQHGLLVAGHLRTCMCSITPTYDRSAHVAMHIMCSRSDLEYLSECLCVYQNRKGIIDVCVHRM